MTNLIKRAVKLSEARLSQDICCRYSPKSNSLVKAEMSEIDSTDNSPAPMEHRPSKRRRYDSETPTPRDSSPDDLPGRQTYRSSNLRERRDSEPRRRSRSRSLDDDSLDEDDRDYRRRRSRSSSRDSGRSSHSSPLAPLSPPSYKPVKLNYKPKFVCKGHEKGVAQVRFSPDGRWLASCSADGTIKVWDVETGQHVRTMEGHLAGISTIAWSPDSNTIASGSDDKTIRLWHRSTGKPYPNALVGHHHYVFSIAFSPKGNMLVSGSYDEAVVLWDLRARKMMRALPAHSDPVGGVDFIKDGTLVCSCSTDGLMYVLIFLITINHKLTLIQTSVGYSNWTMSSNTGARRQCVSYNGALLTEWPLHPRVDTRLLYQIMGLRIRDMQENISRTYQQKLLPGWRFWCQQFRGLHRFWK